MSQGLLKGAQVLFLAVLLAFFWIACVNGFKFHELLLGIPAVIASVAFAFYAIRNVPIRFRPNLRDVVQVWTLPWNAAVDVAQVLWVLLRDLTGQPAGSLFRSAPWQPTQQTAHGTAQRALAVAYTTVSPNCVVIGIDCERGQIFFHQLSPSPLPQMTRKLGAWGGQ